ncbi:MAG: HEAT repeat domain-containing protein [Candidatus Thorarchaeota archaeon]
MKESIDQLIATRQYSELERLANKYIKSGKWRKYLHQIASASSRGKARDYLVTLLQLDSVGGTDSDIFNEFSDIRGTSLKHVREKVHEQAIEILRDQIENRHTFFIDVEAMIGSPFHKQIEDVSETRKRELEQLDGNPSRIEVLGTFYGFSILMSEGSMTGGVQTDDYAYHYYRKKSWLDEDITESAVSAVRQLTRELAKEVDMDKTYATLGSSGIFRGRCEKTTASILSNAVRLAFYKMPGTRKNAAKALGKTQDSRALPFLHNRMVIEDSKTVRKAIAEALGRIGHESSIDVLYEVARSVDKRHTAREVLLATEWISTLHSEKSREALLGVLREGRNSSVRASAINGLIAMGYDGLFDLVTPFLKDRSKPLIRESVSALLEYGPKGEIAIKDNIENVIKRIGADKLSRNVFEEVMSLSGVGDLAVLHKHFARRMRNCKNDIDYWRDREEAHYYFRKDKEKKAMEELTDNLLLAEKYLKPPIDKSLVKILSSITESEQDSTILKLSKKILKRAR